MGDLSAKRDTLHSQIQSEVVTACACLGYQTKQEQQGDGWRADVLATGRSGSIAFEVQLAAQSLQRTLERQSRYALNGIECCWLFERPIPRMITERPDLPVFYVTRAEDGQLSVSLGGRKTMPLSDFIGEYLGGRIKFCRTARATPDQHLKLVFYETDCWKCHALNHNYYAEVTVRAACNAILDPEESLWNSEQMEYRSEIIDAARRFLLTPQGKAIRLGDVKPRYSHTVGQSYTSFGCYKCDSIFGDWYVMEERMEAVWGPGQVAVHEETIWLREPISMPILHWCHTDGAAFCDGSLPPPSDSRR